MNMKEFFLEFRNDHRQIRDLIMDSITAIINKDMGKTRALLNKLDDVAGPHFRFEEEALYPQLITIYGGEYINKLYTDHDLAIARTEKLNEIINIEELSEEDRDKSISMLRGLLPHLSDCEGLTIMVELFNDKKVKRIAKSMEKARFEKLSLLTWSDNQRNRKHLTLIN